MRILQVLAGAKHGGAETAFVDMCLAMQEAGQEVEVATRPNDIRVPRLKEAGIVVHTLPFGGRIDFYTPFMLGRIIEKFQPVIVQCWMSRAAAKVPGWKASMATPRYYVVSRLGGYYKLKYFKSTDYFATITPDIKTHLERAGVAPERVRHINNFAEVEAVKVPMKRADYGVPEGACLLLGLGRLHESKAFDVLIKAAAQMPDIYVWIAGEGPARGVLEALIKAEGLESRVRLLGWQEDRAALFEACDICVFCSRYEPFGTVFVQSWAAQVPVIVSKADGPRQFVREEEDGLMVAIDDAGGIIEATAKIAGDQALRERLVQNGLQRYRTEFTKEACVQNYLDYYQEIQNSV